MAASRQIEALEAALYERIGSRAAALPPAGVA
jgi:hypothetical protein